MFKRSSRKGVTILAGKKWSIGLMQGNVQSKLSVINIFSNNLMPGQFRQFEAFLEDFDLAKFGEKSSSLIYAKEF
jgi:hypothetical protein